MIDYGLVVSIIIAFALPSAIMWRTPLDGAAQELSFVDVALGPAMIGLAVGRLVALALDDPSSIGSVSDMAIIRSGVEFWPGVAAASATVLWSEWRAGLPLLVRLAPLVPLAMVGYAGYEAACVFRDGCFGPETVIGLRPPGLRASMLPVGWLMAAAVATAALALRTAVARRWPPVLIVAAGMAAVATVRAIGSVWLPHVGEGLTRQHATSIVVAVGAVVVVVPVALSGRGGRLPAGSSRQQL